MNLPYSTLCVSSDALRSHDTAHGTKLGTLPLHILVARRWDLLIPRADPVIRTKLQKKVWKPQLLHFVHRWTPTVDKQVSFILSLRGSDVGLLPSVTFSSGYTDVCLTKFYLFIAGHRRWTNKPALYFVFVGATLDLLTKAH